MTYCNKCGNKVRDNIKFCPNCGSPINSNQTSNTSDDIDNNSPIKIEKKSQGKFKIILVCVILLLLLSVASGVTYMKISAAHKDNIEKSIEILNVDIDKYPEITVSLKVNNYENKLNAKDVTIKENDAFQKDLKLSDGVNSNEYKITYKTSDESSSTTRSMKVACVLDGKEILADYSYTPTEKKQEGNQKSNTNNSVSTYDNNEVKVKNALNNYETAYIRMINSKNIDYIKSSIDLSGELISEFTSLIKSYSDQQITEDLISSNIEEIKKINDTQYEVTVYEKYHISYGKEKKTSYTDFRDTYVVKMTDSEFKVYAIKDVVTLSNKQNP